MTWLVRKRCSSTLLSFTGLACQPKQRRRNPENLKYWVFTFRHLLFWIQTSRRASGPRVAKVVRMSICGGKKARSLLSSLYAIRKSPPYLAIQQAASTTTTQISWKLKGCRIPCAWGPFLARSGDLDNENLVYPDTEQSCKLIQNFGRILLREWFQVTPLTAAVHLSNTSRLKIWIRFTVTPSIMRPIGNIPGPLVKISTVK